MEMVQHIIYVQFRLNVLQNSSYNSTGGGAFYIVLSELELLELEFGLHNYNQSYTVPGLSLLQLSP